LCGNRRVIFGRGPEERVGRRQVRCPGRNGSIFETLRPQRFLKPDIEKPERDSGGTQSMHHDREELLLRIRRSKMNPDPA